MSKQYREWLETETEAAYDRYVQCTPSKRIPCADDFDVPTPEEEAEMAEAFRKDMEAGVFDLTDEELAPLPARTPEEEEAPF